jgi:hypothetical protein
MAKATSSTDDVASLKPGIGELTQELAQARAELDEGHLREAATAELLKVISRTKFELQPVLDTVGENAARLCDANNAVIYRLQGTRWPHMGSSRVRSLTHVMAPRCYNLEPSLWDRP